MWSAIKSDLFEFVNTIQQDTTTTLNKVLGENDENEQDAQATVLDKLRVSVRRTYETYANPLKENKAREFEKFKKKFHLTSFSKDIAIALDEEPEVSRFYAELVPVHISPEEFWSRLFFRLHLVNRNGTASFEDDDDDDEELVWEEDVVVAHAEETLDGRPTSFSVERACAETVALQNRIQELEGENFKLKGQVKSLISRVAQLELELKSKSSLPPVNHQDTTHTKITTECVRGATPEPTSPSSEGSGVLVSNQIPSALSMSFSTPLLEKENKEDMMYKPGPNNLASLDDDEDEDGWN